MYSLEVQQGNKKSYKNIENEAKGNGKTQKLSADIFANSKPKGNNQDKLREVEFGIIGKNTWQNNDTLNPMSQNKGVSSSGVKESM